MGGGGVGWALVRLSEPTHHSKSLALHIQCSWRYTEHFGQGFRRYTFELV